VTYRELSNILRKLGYRDESYDNRYRYVNDEHNSIVLLRMPKHESEKVLKADFAGYSYALSEQGVIEDPHDLAKMIEKERLALSTSAA
jgi:hypothetical protein